MGISSGEVEGEHVPVLLLRVEEAARRLGIGRSSMYRLLASGDIESVRVGGLRRIPVPALDDYVDRLRRGTVVPSKV